jgi:uncharacterized protein with HEPN domain
MRLESKKYLYDVARAAGLALEFVRGKSFAEYAADALLRSAVERQLEIVGEALAQLPKNIRERRRGSANTRGSLPFATF